MTPAGMLLYRIDLYNFKAQIYLRAGILKDAIEKPL